jgi:hypothetical protein
MCVCVCFLVRGEETEARKASLAAAGCQVKSRLLSFANVLFVVCFGFLVFDMARSCSAMEEEQKRRVKQGGKKKGAVRLRLTPLSVCVVLIGFLFLFVFRIAQ